MTEPSRPVIVTSRNGAGIELVTFLIVLFFSYYWHGLGVTVGYHRLLSHRSFRCPKIVEYFWVLGGYLALEGSPAWWAAVHRAHHKHADTPDDPHSPRDGYKHSYFKWMFKQDPHIIDVPTLSPDILRDPVYRILDTGDDALLLVANIGYRVALYFLFGWQVALASLVAGLMILQLPLILNLFCHIPRLGYKNFDTVNDAVNVWWVAVIAGGEGWHNNHHAFPSSARHGLAKNEFDLTWTIIQIQRFLGLSSHAYLPSADAIVDSPEALLPFSPLANNAEILKARAKRRAKGHKKLLVGLTN
ncbi:MAG: fatty acid desaturase [Candidatus Obscuribacterales bacterium]|nr:fatty acid desaturase [Candidatus Obscuribacterales bacterium]